jgi:hypothetical protein
MRGFQLAAVAAALAAGSFVGTAHATFVVDTSCGQSMCAAGTKMFIDSANKNVSTFGAAVSGNAITVDTTGNVDTGSGFATIKPTKGGTLTDLIFTPASDTLFNDFSFRGQLEKSGFTGTIDVIWTDSTGGTGTIPFTVSKPNADFNRLGIVSLDGELLKSVEIMTPGSESFKEVKQVEFSFATPPVPAPASAAVLMTGLLGLLVTSRRRRKSG